MLRSVYSEVSAYPGGIQERKREVAVYSSQVDGDQSRPQKTISNIFKKC